MFADRPEAGPYTICSTNRNLTRTETPGTEWCLGF